MAFIANIYFDLKVKKLFGDKSVMIFKCLASD